MGLLFLIANMEDQKERIQIRYLLKSLCRDPKVWIMEEESDLEEGREQKVIEDTLRSDLQHRGKEKSMTQWADRGLDNGPE